MDANANASAICPGAESEFNAFSSLANIAIIDIPYYGKALNERYFNNYSAIKKAIHSHSNVLTAN
jgi:hypothetical protein